MKAKEIQDLIDFISNSGLAEVKIETDEFKLSIKKHADNSGSRVESTPVQQQAAPQTAEQQASSNAPQKPAPPTETQEEKDAKNYVEIKSPMIGTFYRMPNPDADMFVNVGDSVTAGDTVCIIEAMKLFNEIESEVTGKIVKVLVDNAQPVEYDQPLFLVDPAG